MFYETEDGFYMDSQGEGYEIPVDEDGCYYEVPILYSFFDLVKQMEALYITYRKRFVMMTRDGRVFIPKKKNSPIDQNITRKVVCAHMNGRFAICVYAGSCSSKFICFDVDDGNEETVHKIVDTLEGMGFPRDRIYVSTSGGKGFHVEMFFSSLMFTKDLKSIYNYVCDTAKLDRKKVEFRPTAGQSIKLPLSVHRKTGRTCWYLDRETLEPIRNQEFIMEIQQIPHEDAMKIVWMIPIKIPSDGEVIEEEDESDEKDNVAECELTEEDRKALEGGFYPDLRDQGSRHAMMTQIAVHNRYRGLTMEQAEKELQSWYSRQNPEFITSTPREVDQDIRKIINWAYGGKFVIKSRTAKEMVFRRDDVRMLLAQKKRSERAVLFQVMQYMKLYGTCCMSMARMVKATGMSIYAVNQAVQSLKESNWIEVVSRAKTYLKDGGYTRTPARYRVSEKAYTWACGDFTYMPGVEEDDYRKINRIPMLAEEVRFDPNEEGFGMYRVLAAFLPDKAAKRFLTNKEYQEFMKEEKRNECDEGNGGRDECGE